MYQVAEVFSYIQLGWRARGRAPRSPLLAGRLKSVCRSLAAHAARASKVRARVVQTAAPPPTTPGRAAGFAGRLGLGVGTVVVAQAGAGLRFRARVVKIDADGHGMDRVVLKWTATEDGLPPLLPHRLQGRRRGRGRLCGGARAGVNPPRVADEGQSPRSGECRPSSVEIESAVQGQCKDIFIQGMDVWMGPSVWTRMSRRASSTVRSPVIATRPEAAST